MLIIIMAKMVIMAQVVLFGVIIVFTLRGMATHKQRSKVMKAVTQDVILAQQTWGQPAVRYCTLMESKSIPELANNGLKQTLIHINVTRAPKSETDRPSSDMLTGSDKPCLMKTTMLIVLQTEPTKLMMPDKMTKFMTSNSFRSSSLMSSWLWLSAVVVKVARVVLNTIPSECCSKVGVVLVELV